MHGFLITLFLSTICLFGNPNFVWAQLQGDSWEKIKNMGSGTIIVSYIEESGFAYQNSQGQLTGVTIDIFNQFVNYIQNTRDVTIKVDYRKADDFVAFYEDVKQAKTGVFGLGNVTITESRKEEIGFSQPYLTNIAVLITHSSVPTLSNLEELSTQFKGFTGIVYQGTTHETRLRDLKRRYLPSLKLSIVQSDQEVLSKISSDETSFAYTDLSVFWIATKDNMPIKRHPVADEASENFGIIFPKGSDWKPLLDEFFNLGSGYRSNPAYRRILVKHLGAEVTQMLEMAIH